MKKNNKSILLRPLEALLISISLIISIVYYPQFVYAKETLSETDKILSLPAMSMETEPCRRSKILSGVPVIHEEFLFEKQVIPQSRNVIDPISDEFYEQVLNTAKSCLGVPYLPAGRSRGGFDCSGFIYYILRQNGYDIEPASCIGQIQICQIVEEPQPGDLVFFKNTTSSSGITHVGYYIGNDTMIHAGSKGIAYANIYDVYWESKFACFARLPQKYAPKNN